MFELMAVIGDLSTPVKVGWTLWFAWGVISFGWYRHARVAAYVAPAMPTRFVPPPLADMEPHEEDLMYSEPTYSDSNGSSAHNY